MYTGPKVMVNSAEHEILHANKQQITNKYSCIFAQFIDRWMDGLLFYVLFNSISVISGKWEVDNERLCAMQLRL